MDNSQWLSVKDIVSKYKKFNVPSLQRTYRWGEKEITLLLNDLYEFYNTNEDSTNDFYPLQPLILKKSNQNDDTWNVLDGQQRLTTIKLIASFLGMDKDYCLDISYDTREKTKDFLDNISNKKEEDVGKSMELYYIFHAYEVIKAWFQKKEGRKFLEDKERKNAIKNVLFEKERTRFVVQEMNIDDDEAKTFQNINQGRIPLSCSELIKALFLGHIFESHKSDNNCRFAYSSDGYGLFIPINPIKERQSLTRLQNIIAKEWDDIETVLMHDEFYSFVCPEKDRSINRMDFLFKVVCGNEKYKKYKTDDPFDAIYESIKEIKNNDKNKNLVDILSTCWNEVVKCFNRMQKLYYDFDAYHLVGFCICEDIGISEDFYKYCNEDEKLDEFKTAIRVKIKGKLLNGLKTDDLDEESIEKLQYKDSKNQIKEILLLHNLQSYSYEKIRFPFNLYDGGKNYDIEHIHATAEEKADKKSRYEWFDTNHSAIKKKRKKLEDPNLITLFDSFEEAYGEKKSDKKLDKFKNDKEFNKLRDIMIIDNFDNDDAKEYFSTKDGIWNLCLLDSTTNRTYKNSLFITKREMILKKAKGEMDKEDYVYPLLLCTERIFLKFYSNVDSDDNLNFWTLNNREAYLKDISKKVTDFLKLKGEDTNG